MYGTTAKLIVRPENKTALFDLIREQDYSSVPGFVGSYSVIENDSDVVWNLAIFADRESYDRNADDPAQHERYLAYRALLEADPEWHDGEIVRI